MIVLRIHDRKECGPIFFESYPHHVPIGKQPMKLAAFFANDLAQVGIEIVKVVKDAGAGGVPHTVGYWAPEWAACLLEPPFSRADRVLYGARLLEQPDLQRAIVTAFRLGGGLAAFRLISGEAS